MNNTLFKKQNQQQIEYNLRSFVIGITAIILFFAAIQLIVEVFGEESNRTIDINNQLVNLDLTIQEGLTNCFDLESNNCIAVMSTLDQVCQSIYSPYCFGDLWTKFVEYKQELIDSGSLPEYEEDSYYNLNNDHFGNDSMSK